MSKIIAPGLKPKVLGLGNNYGNISVYTKAVIKGIDTAFDDFKKTHKGSDYFWLDDYADYLKHLVENAGTSKTFPKFKELVKILNNTPAENGAKNSIDEINIYFAEVIGPIAIVKDRDLKGKTAFDMSSSVYVPTISNERGYDFKIGGVEVTVKKSTGKTNTLKPLDLIQNKQFKKLVNKSNNKVKFIFKLMERLSEESALMGAYSAIYGDNGRNGILKELIGNKPEQDSVLIPSNNVPVPKDIISMYANALEMQLQIWSQSPSWNPAFIEFTNLYYNTIGLYAFSYTVKRSNGIGTPSFKNQVKGAHLAGKGRAGPFGTDFQGNKTNSTTKVKGEKVGIQMLF